MRQKRARVLAPADGRRLLTHVRGHRHALRNRVMILLSFKAGLRACEIAGLAWPMLLTPTGLVGDAIGLAGSITKGGRDRAIPLHAELRSALTALHRDQGRPLTGAVIASERRRHMTPQSIFNWFAATYAEAGLDGRSSHSGRRTFITRAARQIGRSGGSLRDVQELAARKSRIRALNDQLRITGTSGRFMITPGIQALPATRLSAAPRRRQTLGRGVVLRFDNPDDAAVIAVRQTRTPIVSVRTSPRAVAISAIACRPDLGDAADPSFGARDALGSCRAGAGPVILSCLNRHKHRSTCRHVCKQSQLLGMPLRPIT